MLHVTVMVICCFYHTHMQFLHQKGETLLTRSVLWLLVKLCWFSDISRSLSHGVYTLEPAVRHTHTHTRLTAPCPGLPGWAGTRKIKPVWILLEQETVSGSSISWAICVSTSLQTDNHASTPLLSFLQAGCPSCRPTNSVKALKGVQPAVKCKHHYWITHIQFIQPIVQPVGWTVQMSPVRLRLSGPARTFMTSLCHSKVAV